MIKYRLLADHGIKPHEFGELTYADVVNILARGQAGKADRDAMRARKTVADFRSGKLKWDD